MWKNVHFFEHPKKENPTYREEALLRDDKIQFCPVFGGNFGARNLPGEERIDRCFMWKDSKWPWSILIS